MTGQRRDRARQVTEVLARRYPEAAVTLTHRTPWELLTGAILASQCTDERVNRVTPQLFERFPDPETMAGADQEELESLIRSCGLSAPRQRRCGEQPGWWRRNTGARCLQQEKN